MSQKNIQDLRLVRRMRPEVECGGFSRYDLAIQFYGRVNALLRPDMTVLDLGAGRGSFLDKPDAYISRLQNMKGRVAEVIGMDVDPAVAQNRSLDRYEVIDPDQPLPLGDSQIDLILSDWTLEHVDHPERFAAEVYRVLKPGGWLCARTPNKWGLTGVAARLVPNALHTRVLKWVQPHRKEVDVFPVRYRLNTRSAIRKYFPATKWIDCTYSWNGEPAYHAESAALWNMMSALFHLAPAPLQTNLLIFVQKKGSS